MPDRVSMYRVARLSLYPPSGDHGQARYACIASTITHGIPRATVLFDGVLSGVATHPQEWEVIEAMDAALRQQRLV